MPGPRMLTRGLFHSSLRSPEHSPLPFIKIFQSRRKTDHILTLTDTHCHLYFEQFHKDMDQVLERSADAGVTHIFLPAIDFNTSAELKNLSHPRITFYPMAGIHPGSVEKEHPIDFEILLLLCEEHDVVRVGVTVLDYYCCIDVVMAQNECIFHC